MKIHLVYPASEAINTPFAIGRELSQRLRKHYDVVVHSDIRAKYCIDGSPEDVIIGHPTWEPQSVFNASISKGTWRNKICIHPFNIDLKQTAHLSSIIDQSDQFLAITGNYWIQQLPNSVFKHIAPVTKHLDLAVNTDHFPAIIRRFNSPTKRRFLYIGNHPWYKNLDYLNKIAAALPEYEFAWMGSQKKRYKHLKQYGFTDFSKEESKNSIKKYDFMITVGNADANPTTILEAMAWGLIPVCTPQSGYDNEKGIINVPLGNVQKAISIIRNLQAMETQDLLALQSHNWKRLEEHFNWNRFANDVINAIEFNATNKILEPSLSDQIKIAYWQLKSPNSRWRLKKIKRRLLTPL